ncbi:MAG TPA: hypothetical protein VGF27_05725 [Pseudoduganella sp.]
MREFVIGQLGFLDAQHIDRIFAQPFEHVGQADIQGVHIPGGEFHTSSFQISIAWASSYLNGYDPTLLPGMSYFQFAMAKCWFFGAQQRAEQ